MHLSIPVMHHVKLLISALLTIDVHGVVFPCLVCWSRPLRQSKGWGRDSMVSEPKVATMGLYGI